MTKNFLEEEKGIELIKKIYSFDDDFIIKEDLDFILWYWEDKEFNFNLEHIESFLNKMKEELKEKEEQLKELENYINNIKKEWK
jgi:hypothetical protein